MTYKSMETEELECKDNVLKRELRALVKSNNLFMSLGKVRMLTLQIQRVAGELERERQADRAFSKGFPALSKALSRS